MSSSSPFLASHDPNLDEGIPREHELIRWEAKLGQRSRNIARTEMDLSRTRTELDDERDELRRRRENFEACKRRADSIIADDKARNKALQESEDTAKRLSSELNELKGKLDKRKEELDAREARIRVDTRWFFQREATGLLLNMLSWTLICAVASGMVIDHLGDQEWNCDSFDGPFFWSAIIYVFGVALNEVAVVSIRRLGAMDEAGRWLRHVVILEHLLGPLSCIVGSALSVKVSNPICNAH